MKDGLYIEFTGLGGYQGPWIAYEIPGITFFHGDSPGEVVTELLAMHFRNEEN